MNWFGEFQVLRPVPQAQGCVSASRESAVFCTKEPILLDSGRQHRKRGKWTLGDHRKNLGPQPQSLTDPRACCEPRAFRTESGPRTFSLLFLFLAPPLAHLPPLAPSSQSVSRALSGLAECGERLGAHEHADLTDGSQHLNSSCYPSTCITDILLSYKHPEVSFSMEQAGV